MNPVIRILVSRMVLLVFAVCGGNATAAIVAVGNQAFERYES